MGAQNSGDLNQWIKNEITIVSRMSHLYRKS